MSNTLPLALTRLLGYISTINSVLIFFTHMTTMLLGECMSCLLKLQGKVSTGRQAVTLQQGSESIGDENSIDQR